MPPADQRTGSIYDLGYRRYDGLRLGRQHAVLSLYVYTLRGAFGIGRRASSKIIPIIITVIAFLPALIQLGVAAIVSDEVDIIRPENYFGFVQVPVALFCAAIAPEITGRTCASGRCRCTSRERWSGGTMPWQAGGVRDGVMVLTLARSVAAGG